MPVPDYLGNLHSHYAELALADPAALTSDEARSLDYYRADIVIRDHPELFHRAVDRVSVWIRQAHTVDRLVLERGEVPRRNTRAAAPALSVAGRRAAVWLEDQRRPSARRRQSAYQSARIDAYPGIDVRTHGERWIDAFSDYADFLSEHREVPTARSEDPLQRRLALWATNQRRSYRAGTLAPERAVLLRTLPIWTWGASRTNQ